MDFSVSYTDDDGDLVMLSSDHDLDDSVKTARKQGRDRVLLIVKGGKGWENAMAPAAEQQQQEKKKTLNVVHEDEEDPNVTRDDFVPDNPDARIANTKKKAKKASSSNEELVFGFLQKSMALPAAIAFLGVAVIGVFAMSRTSK